MRGRCRIERSVGLEGKTGWRRSVQPKMPPVRPLADFHLRRELQRRADNPWQSRKTEVGLQGRRGENESADPRRVGHRFPILIRDALTAPAGGPPGFETLGQLRERRERGGFWSCLSLSSFADAPGPGGFPQPFSF